MNQQRLPIIIKTLLQSNKPVKSSELCKKINVTSRTLRSDIRESKSELLNHGIEITSIPAIGYKLAVVDELLKYNIEPMVTLFHFEMPVAIVKNTEAG